MPDVTAYVDDRQSSEFYPTPEKLVQRMLGKIKWDPVEAILEPSAGKGDILRGLATAATERRNYGKAKRSLRNVLEILSDTPAVSPDTLHRESRCAVPARDLFTDASDTTRRRKEPQR